MAERPILFNAEMVRAILAGRKTQTRRPVAGSPVFVTQFIGRDNKPTHEYGLHPESEYVISKNIRCPLGRPGDRLWVRETWGLHAHSDFTYWNRDSIVGLSEDDVRGSWAVAYQSDAESPYDHWRPSVHMPRWASRIALEVTDVRVQRVQEITAEEAVAEGVRCHICDGRVDGTSENDCACFHTARNAVPSFEFLWRSIYGAESWQQNAWVWAVTFRRLP